MPARDSAHEFESERLRDLHEAYAGEVNAAVAEGREDLVRQLSDDYLEAALRAMTDTHPDPCGRPGCTACARPWPARPPGPSRRSRLHAFFSTFSTRFFAP